MTETLPLPMPEAEVSEAVAASTSIDVASAAPATPEPATAEAAPSAPAAPATPSAMNPVECAQQLKQRFPALFAGAVKPLKLRVQVDIQARVPGVFSKQALSAFFRRHTGSTSYLIAMTKAPHRFDLDGQPAGEITEEHRQVALDELARRRSSQDERRQIEEQQRRNRAGLLHDFQTTTLTKANFSALKGVPLEELDGLLELARGEMAERARQAPAPSRAPAGDRPPRHADGDRSRRSGGRTRG